jgi:quercetin dioxygenase-like cupin family protein
MPCGASAEEDSSGSGRWTGAIGRRKMRWLKSLQNPGEALMNKLIIPAVLVATGIVAAAAWSQPVTLSVLNKRYFTMPLENDPTREVGLQSVLMPPGAGNEFHRHPGDQWTAIQEGEITYTIKGQPPQVLKPGDSNYVPRGTIHRQQNLSDKPARYIEMRVFDKGKPPSELVGG